MKSKILKMVKDELKSLSKVKDVSDSMKAIKLFTTSKQVEKFRSDLEKGTEERFKEIDRNKRKAFIRSKETILD